MYACYNCAKIYYSCLNNIIDLKNLMKEMKRIELEIGVVNQKEVWSITITGQFQIFYSILQGL